MPDGKEREVIIIEGKNRNLNCREGRKTASGFKITGFSIPTRQHKKTAEYGNGSSRFQR
jgi:hypothetical protein